MLERITRMLRGLGPRRAVEIFVVANLAFLAVDIALAHAANAFARASEWVPVVFSGLATLALLPGTMSPRMRARLHVVDWAVGLGAVGVGVTGMVLHLESAFFEERTLHMLVYSAPFIAPLSYVGVGLLLLLVRMEPESSPDFGRWVVVLALGGFAGNLALSLLDHAQNGFFSATEWIAVAAAAFGASFLLVAAVRPGDRRFLRVCFSVLAVEAGVGLLGFALHLRGDLGRPTGRILDGALYGAPVFAPLLFTNLALLAALGIWSLLLQAEASAGSASAAPEPVAAAAE